MSQNAFNQALFLIALLSASSLQAQESLLLTLGYEHSAGKHASTQSFPTLHTQDGTELVLQQSTGSAYRLAAPQHGWTWFQVQEIPVAETYISLTPEVDGESVSLAVRYSNRSADNAFAYSSTVSGKLNTWITIVSDDGQESQRSVKRYSSSGQLRGLSIKVERMP